MIIKKIIVSVFVLYVTIVTGTWAFAENCPNVVGNWDCTANKVYYESATDTYSYETTERILYVTSQDGCLFYGYWENPDDPENIKPAIGVINRQFVTWISRDRIREGVLAGYDPLRGIYTKIIYTTIDPAGEKIMAGKGIASRR